jgi:hypothetical protein
VNAFAALVLGGILLVVLFVFLLGRATEGSSLDQFGLRSPREITETKEALEAEDLHQMLAAANARRRARGEPERTVEEVEMQVMRDRNEQMKRREDLLADRELDQLLEATNARRRTRGLPDRSREDVRREFGAPDA